VSGLSHGVLPYSDAAEFLAGALPFLRGGIEAGDRVVAVTGEERLGLLQEWLGTEAVQVEFQENRTFYSHPARSLAGWVAQADELAAHGRRLRLVAEPAWQGRTALETAEWQRVEAVVNVAFAGTGASILCPYALSLLPTAILDGAWRSHPAAVRGHQWRPNTAYMDPWSYASTIDRMPLPPPPESAEAWRIDAADLYWLRAFIREYTQAVPLEDWELQCLLMSVTEVATNALRYGEPPVVLRLWTESASERRPEIVCEISNGGHWSPPPGHGLVPPEATAPSRFGLWAVRLLCSIVQVRTGRSGTTVRMRLPAGSAGVAAHSV
jgi:hypothetical protein